jgi:hypothetical protein
MITIEDFKKIQNLNFWTYEEYISEFERKNETDSHYIYFPEKSRFSFGCLQHSKKDVSTLITSKYWTGSDYSGTTVELSNYQVFLEKFRDLLGTAIFDVWGGYSTFSVAISLKWLTDSENEEKAQEIIDVLQELDRYPVIDEDHLSGMELEKENDYITNDWLYDLNREMKKQHSIEITNAAREQIWDLYYDLSERSNSYPMFENNGAPYIDTEQLVKSYKIGDLTRLGIEHGLIP